VAVGWLFIRETKFSKSRIVPLGPKLAERVRRYIEERYGEKSEPGTPLFSFTKRGCIHPGTISQTFHKLLPKLKLPIPPGVVPPRLHDRRRSFAVATLLRWYRDGIDPNSRLMYLPRSWAMLLYNSGARAQEIADLRVSDVGLVEPLRVRLHGKGDKWRSCPFWQTAKALKQLATVRCGDKVAPLLPSPLPAGTGP
jgi:integrase